MDCDPILRGALSAALAGEALSSKENDKLRELAGKIPYGLPYGGSICDVTDRQVSDASAGGPLHMPDIPSQIDVLKQQCGDLHDVVAILEKQLTPILRTADETQEAAQYGPRAETPLGTQIQDCSIKILAVRSRIIDLIDRIAV